MNNNPKYYKAKEKVIVGLGNGIVNIPSDPELIPAQAAQDSLGWISTDGQIELCKGKLLVGADETATGFAKGEGWGFTSTGTKVHFRKVNTKIQYYNTTSLVWVDIVTGLTASAEYTFSPYQSLAGTFVYATGVDGIYKIHTANPGSYTQMYDSTRNQLGYSMIVQSRMSMWNVKGSLTTHFMSHTDAAQDSTIYTTIVGEATAAASSGTLAFKAAGALRTCFMLSIIITTGGEVFTDNYDGTLTGSQGHSGTINYTTGAWTLTVSSAGTATYSWENSNVNGVTDFTYSATRTALEGDRIRQDEGGDAILNIIFHEGTYYSFKTHSVYSLTITSTGLYFENIVYRKDIGLPYWRSAISTSKGIVFLDTSNVSKPQLTILQYNINDNLEPAILASQFDFSKYVWDMSPMGTFGEFIVFSGRTSNSTINNKLFLYNVRNNTVDVLPYGAKTITNSEGVLYIGDVLTDNIYAVLNGWDDDGDTIQNYWISNDEKYGSEYLKKLKRIRFKGLITKDQTLEVYVSYDGDTFTKIGTILGNGTYVDFSTNYTIGSNGIGVTVIGGETDTVLGNNYLAEIKISGSKFRKRKLKLVAGGIGYISVNMINDFDIRFFQQKLPSRYRTKQNVNIAGTLTNL